MNIAIGFGFEAKIVKNVAKDLVVCGREESSRVWEAFEVWLSKLNLCICSEFATPPSPL